MEQGSRKHYSKEYKINAVRMVLDEGRGVREVSRDLGVSATALYHWKQSYLENKEDSFPGKGNLIAQSEYVKRLERENIRLKSERDILKKAAIFFAKEPQ